jgi:S-formylglutathione hydrolase FrmB
MREVGGVAGAPWERELAGRLDELVVDSELLAGNPLGDPSQRPLLVYSAPAVADRQAADVASVYMIQGYSGQVDMWTARSAFEPTVIERLDTMFAAGECPPAVVVFVDAWTSLGGSQFLNSTSTGRYLDYLCDEIVPFVDGRYPTAADREHRGLAGKSSGGYGAMVVPMLRPEVFGALASHAGDALFECSYLPEFPKIVRTLREHFGGSMDALLAAVHASDRLDWEHHATAFSMYAYAAAYSPDPDRPGKALLPFDTQTGRLVDEVWEQWLALDPVRMAPRYADALASMRAIYLDAGRGDEWYLDLGAQAFSAELSGLGVAHTFELFDGRHGGISYRYPGAVAELVRALS